MIKTSEAIASLAEALTKAQAAFNPAKKDGKNPHFKSTFATLASVTEAVRHPLSESGLSYVQMPFTEEGRVGLTTRLMHTSGEWIECSVQIPMESGGRNNAAQVLGSAITYLRRYTLMAMLGIPSEDDDGNDAGQPMQQRHNNPPNTGGMTEQQGKMIRALMSNLDMDDEDRARFKDHHGITDPREITKAKASEVIDTLQALLKERDGGGA